MKKTVLKMAAVVMLLLSFASCTKKSTTTPANTTPSFSATVSGTALTFTGSATPGSNYFTITGIGTNYTIKMYIPSPASTGTFTLASISNGGYASVATGAGSLWETDASHTGSITITTYNTSSNIVSGTFSFTAAPLSGSSSNVTVTSGSFANISF
jgi:hypothetical protein